MTKEKEFCNEMCLLDELSIILKKYKVVDDKTVFKITINHEQLSKDFIPIMFVFARNQRDDDLV